MRRIDMEEDEHHRSRTSSDESFVFLDLPAPPRLPAQDGAVRVRVRDIDRSVRTHSIPHSTQPIIITPVLRRRRRISTCMDDEVPPRGDDGSAVRNTMTARSISMANFSGRPRSQRRRIAPVNPYASSVVLSLTKKGRMLVVALVSFIVFCCYTSVPVNGSFKRRSSHRRPSKNKTPATKTTGLHLVQKVLGSDLDSFLPKHENVLMIGGVQKFTETESLQWEQFAKQLQDMSLLPLPIVVARIDCSSLSRQARNQIFLCGIHGVHWFRKGQEIDSYTRAMGREFPMEFVRGMLALSRDETTQRAVARLPNGYIGTSMHPRTRLRQKEEMERAKIATHQKRSKFPDGTTFFGDDGNHWALKAEDEDTRAEIYNRWSHTGVRYLVDEKSFDSFLAKNKKQAFVLFCSYNTANCNGDMRWKSMHSQKEKQSILEMPFAEVPCGVTPRLCLQQNITVHPTLRSYVNGVAEEPELTEAPMGDARIMRWTSRHSKLDRFPGEVNDDTRGVVVSPSNYTSFAREHTYIFLYVHEEGHGSSAIENALYDFSKGSGRIPLVFAKVSVPTSLLKQKIELWSRRSDLWTHSQDQHHPALRGGTWNDMVGPSGRALYFHSDQEDILQLYSGGPSNVLGYIQFIKKIKLEALEKEKPIEQLQREKERSEGQERWRERPQQPQETDTDEQIRLKQALLLFHEELPDESDRIRQEKSELLRAKRKKFQRYASKREGLKRAFEFFEEEFPDMTLLEFASKEETTMSDADKYPGFVEDGTGDAPGQGTEEPEEDEIIDLD